MAILSKVKRAAKKVATKVASAVKKVGGAITSALTGKSSANMASAVSALPSQTKAPLQTKAPTPVLQTKAPNMTVAPRNSDPGGPGFNTVSGPVSINDPSFKSSQKQGLSLAGSGTTMSSPIYSAPVSIMGGETPMMFSEGAEGDSESSNNSISSSSLASAPSVSLPSAPTYSNPGQINNGGLVGALADTYSYDTEKNMFVPSAAIQTSPTSEAETTKRSKLQKLLERMIPEKENVYDSREIRAQQREVQERKQEVANYTAQLNSVVAQQNADLLRLRGIGAQEGVTETVYGGQAATINREAAIKALPIQAQISASQGNLELAQDYLTQLTTWKQEQINNEYNYKNALYSSIKDYVTGEEKIRLDELRTQNDRVYESTKSNIARQDAWAKFAMENGHVALGGRISQIDPTSPNFAATLGSLTSNIKDTGGGEGNYTERQLKAITKLNQDVSKNATYAKTTSMRNYGDNVVASLSQGTGVGDIAAINQFQKVIDEGAVTRDQDVKLIQGAQSLANTLKTKIKKLEKGEALSPELRQQMRKVVEDLYDAQVKALNKDPYIKAKTKEAELYGLTSSDTILGELGGFTRESSISGQTITAPDGTQVIITD